MCISHLGLAAWLALLLWWPQGAFAQAAAGATAPIPRIIHVARNLDRGNTPDGLTRELIYYLDKGTADNINKGDALNVYREVRVGPHSMRIFIGTMTITDSQLDSAMGRFTPSPAISSQPLIKYKTALKSDLVMPRLALDTSILFDQGQFNLKPGVSSEFDKVGQIIKGFPSAKILISGHTDSDGDAQINQKLSEQRAEAVRLYLINTFNIEASRIESKGFGEEQPIVNNDTPENKTLNRRIEFSVWE
jgi:outer membrane protein OmpA-like peptidoglycan-associated protein